MFPLMVPMLIGGGIGLLTNKKNPLEGALMGAGMGAAGGLLSPAAAGATAELGAAGAGGLSTGTAVPGLSTGTAVPGLNAAAAAPPPAPWYDGVLSTAKEVAGNAKPVADAAGTAMMVAQMTKEEPPPPIQASPVMVPGNGSNPQMQGLLQSIQSTDAQRAQEEMQKRQTNRAMRGY
jgi:hypothetical protein